MPARERYLAGRRVHQTRERYTGQPTPTTGSQAAGTTGKHGGLLHILEQGLVDLKDVAVNMPAGVYYTAKGLATDPVGTVKGIGEATLEDLRHPLRHPGYTLLDVLGVAGGGAGLAGRVAAAGRVARTGAAAEDVLRAVAHRPMIEPRTLTRGGLEVKVGSSQAPLAAATQRAVDKALEASAAKAPGGIADRLLSRKIGKVVEAQAKTIQDVNKAPGAALIALGKKLSPAEQKALQVVAEEAPLEGRITASSARVTGARDKGARGRHQAELDLLHAAKEHLAEVDGKPAFTGDQTNKLNIVLGRMREVATSREELLAALGQLTGEAIQGRKTSAGRVALGASYERTPGRKGRGEQIREYPGRSKTVTREMTDPEAAARLAELDDTYNSLVERLVPETSQYGGTLSKQEQLRRNFENSRSGKGGRVGAKRQRTVKAEEFAIAEDKLLQTAERNRGNPAADRVLALVEERDRLRGALNDRSGLGDVATPPALPSLTETIPGKPRRVHLREIAAQKPGGSIVGAEDFTVSPEAVRIPDVATNAPRSLGRPGGVGTAGTVGHQRALGSTTHEYTGALREQAQRREDTTRLVGEAGMEAAKYAGLRHVHELVRQAATPEPTSAGDIAVRLDDLKPNDRTPLEVRRFLDNPDEFFQRATPDEAASAFEQVRQRLFIDPRKLDGKAAAEFRQLHADGKIGFVPRSMLGELAKPHLPIRNKAVSSVDAINNASRFAILYLKPAYAIPNLLGNAALTVLQQGFAAVPNLARAVRLNSRLGPALAARIDALMGEGFARAISAHGQGVLSGAVDKAASLWSKGVDTPFRRSSFLHEAGRAGFKTQAELERLLTDRAHQEKLVEITQRANRELIDYSALSPVEREVIRRVVFFYPWVKGSTVYAGRMLREHPVKAAAIGQLGQVGAENTLEAPSYLQGVFDVGGRLVNPLSAAILQTPAQVGQAAAGLAGGDVGKVGELSNFLSPASALALAAVTRRNRGGYQYPAGTNLGEIAFDQLVKSVPQFTLGQRISDAKHGHGQDRLYPPNVRDALLQYIVGGIAPRKYNRDKLLELAASERSRYIP